MIENFQKLKDECISIKWGLVFALAIIYFVLTKLLINYSIWLVKIVVPFWVWRPNVIKHPPSTPLSCTHPRPFLLL